MEIINTTGSGSGYRVVSGGTGNGTRPLIRRGERLFNVLEEGTLPPNTYVSVPVFAKDQPCIVEFFPPGARTATSSFHLRPAKPGATAEAVCEEPESTEVSGLELEAALPPDQEIEILVTLTQNGNGKTVAKGYRKAAKDPKT
ncbi:MAG TPA: hypothetical protein DD490_10145 [Acidobacteria bacterium]|nr:hypothetical protein [Acidobacteriota bacterium]